METKVIDKLKEFGIEIFNIKSSKDDEEVMIMADNLTIAVKGKEVFVNFHIVAKPCFAARIILILKEIKNIKLFIGEDFVFDENGKFMDGEDALNYHREYVKQAAISQFLQQQQQLYYLSRAKYYEC